ncbi:MAG TPA: DedA family protein [Homoserinimonas sp.]|nr:DedA family protein [Homoserinimonas sp.]
MDDILSWILGTVQGVDPILRTLLAGLAIALETSVLIGLIVPGDTVVIVASTGIANVIEYVALIVAVVAGSLLGESVGFALGRYFGPKIQASRLGRRLGEDHWVRAENYLDRRGGIAVFISRFLPVLHSLVPLTVGMSTMSYRKFMAWTIPACVIWATAYASVGWAAAESYRELSERLHYAGYIFAGIFALFAIIVLVVKKVLARTEARYMTHRGDGDANTFDAEPVEAREGDD